MTIMSEAILHKTIYSQQYSNRGKESSGGIRAQITIWNQRILELEETSEETQNAKDLNDLLRATKLAGSRAVSRI